MKWLKTDDGNWVNLALAVQIRFDGETAKIWFLDGSVSIVSNAESVLAWLRGEPPKDNLIGAFRQSHEF